MAIVVALISELITTAISEHLSLPTFARRFTIVQAGRSLLAAP
jgi:hypothetical protein